MGWRGTIRSVSATLRRMEREAQRQQRESEKERKEIEKYEEAERNAHIASAYENYIDLIQTVHKSFSEGNWNWEDIRNANPPKKPVKVNENEETGLRNLQNYKPNLLDKILGNSKVAKLERAVEVTREQDEEVYRTILVENPATVLGRCASRCFMPGMLICKQ